MGWVKHTSEHTARAAKKVSNLGHENVSISLPSLTQREALISIGKYTDFFDYSLVSLYVQTRQATVRKTMI